MADSHYAWLRWPLKRGNMYVHSDKRKLGFPLVDNLQWGSHFCQFYETQKDLLDIFIPYFKAGLQHNEYCVWVISSPLSIDTAKKALKKAIPGFNKFLDRKQIEIIPDRQWNANGGRSGQAVIAGLDKAISLGFDGLRLASSAVPKKGGKGFACIGIEEISRHNMVAAFAYPRDKFSAIDLMDVVKKHRFALVRNAGKWEVIESSEAQVTKDALKRTEDKLHALFSNMSEGFAFHRIMLNEKGQPFDYIFLEVNEAFEKLTGLKGKDIIGRRVTEVLPGIEKDPTDWIGQYGKVALTGKPIRFESYSEGIGKYYMVSAFSAQRGYFAVTFNDITERMENEKELKSLNEELISSNEELSATNEELASTNEELVAETEHRRETEEDLRASEETLKKAQEIAHIGSWELDLENNRLSWSDEVYRIFGLKPQEFGATYDAFLEAVHPEDREMVNKAYSNSVKEGLRGYEIEHRVVKRLTSKISFVHEKCEHYRDKAGRIIRSVGMVHDITDRKKAEEILTRDKATLEKLIKDRTRELIETQIEMERAKRLSDIGTLASTVAHELRNPLAAINIAVSNVRRKAQNPDIEKSLNNIQKKVIESDQIINNLLFYSRLRPPNYEPANIENLIKECVEVALAHGHKKISIKVYTGPVAKLIIDIDPLQIREVITNILNNSVDAVTDGEGRIEVSAEKHANLVRISICDNGIGIDKEHLERVFDPFFTTKAKGTGLGLAVCRQIMTFHGGTVSIESKVGKGTCVILALPKKSI
ncbi:MAG: ATP-binding protein [bacterium]|nr:ATP-binding protein [bacterium]MDD5756788.1 ATP-binding protein [bacterium]